MKKNKKQLPEGITLDELVSQLTLDEKISLVSGKDFWHTVDIARLKIPSVMVSDGPHGLRKQSDEADSGVDDSITAVCFPSAAGLASSFNRTMMYRLGKTLGEECQAENVSTLLGPAINIKRSPLCGRNFEYLSEDPYVAGELAYSYIKGVQSTGTGVSVKHFAVNSQEKRRMTVSAEVDERALREIYLKGFETAVKKSQPRTVMCAYNKVNGEYCSENKKLLTDILRDEWGFKGLVMSDWGAVCDRAKGLEAGLDLEMPGSSGIGAAHIKQALDEGTLDEKYLDVSCRRILNHVFKWSQNRQQFDFDRCVHHEKAKEAALQSMVLLKNDGKILPLDGKKKIAFIGEFAEKPRFQGGGSSHIKPYKVSSAVEMAGIYADVEYARGYDTKSAKNKDKLIAEAVETAKNCDISVIFAGLPDSYESEGFDRANMYLPPEQNELIEAVLKVTDKVVVVLHNGSPVEMPWIDRVPAVLECYLGGEAVGEAQTEILFGKSNPSGKLAETFPVSIGDTPCFETFPGTWNTVQYRESIYVGYRYYSTFSKRVLFPFGHGLSYTTFKYSDLKVDNKNIFKDHGAVIEVTVTNTGSVYGGEVVQLYVAPVDSAVYRSAVELKGFEKVFLKPGESKTVIFRLDENDFAYYNVKEKAFVCENGIYEIRIGSSSADIRMRDRFNLSGFRNPEMPYTERVNEAYKHPDVGSVGKDIFEELLGRKVEVDIPQKPFTLENCIIDAKDTKAGAMIIKAIDLTMQRENEAMGNAEMIHSSALENPIRSFVAMSQGRVGEKAGQAIVDILNGEKLSASVIKLISGLINK